MPRRSIAAGTRVLGIRRFNQTRYDLLVLSLSLLYSIHLYISIFIARYVCCICMCAYVYVRLYVNRRKTAAKSVLIESRADKPEKINVALVRLSFFLRPPSLSLLPRSSLLCYAKTNYDDVLILAEPPCTRIVNFTLNSTTF